MVSHRLITEQHSHHLAEAESVCHDGIQDTFRLKVQCQVKKAYGSSQPQSTDHGYQYDAVAVKALLDAQDHWEAAVETRAVAFSSVCLRLLAAGTGFSPCINAGGASA